MKIRILTQPLGHNIGGVLQNYALSTVCKEYSNDVKTLNIPFPSKISFLILKYGACIKRLFIKFFINRKVIVRWWKSLKIPYYSDIVFLKNSSELNSLDCRDAVFIVGSDQVWRKDISPDIKTFFGSFLPDYVPRIAYAASFGVNRWQFDKKETKIVVSLLQKFRAISVRENSAVHLLAEQGIQSQLVLDPTLLLAPKDYAGLETVDSLRFAATPHIFIYCLDKHPHQEELSISVSNATGLSIMNIMADFQLDNWISGLRLSDYVITDSFHGTVFSILFHKKFVVVANKKRGITRLESLLKRFHLENRLINSFNDFKLSVLQENIDFEQVDSILKFEKEKSLKFLEDNLK